MVDKKDIKDAASYAVIGGMAGLGVATLTDDTIHPNYAQTVNEAAGVKTVEEALANRPDPTKMNPQEFAKADKEWAESIAQKALQNEKEIKQERNAPKKAADYRKTESMLGGVLGGGLFATGVAGWKRREEKKKAAAVQGGNDKSV